MAANRRGYLGWLVAAALVLTFLASSGVWNPFPGLWKWINQDRPLSEPAPAWQQRLGGTPRSITVAGGTLVVEQRTSVEALRISDGTEIWSKRADWSAVAGTGNGSAAVFGRLLVKGYDVVDPATGSLLRHDSQAVAVWTYQDAILDLRCHRPKDCALTAWAPRGNTPQWSAEVPGSGFVLFADNPKLQGTHPLNASKVEERAGGPEAMPRLLGFPVDGGVHIVDTAEGQALPEVKLDRREQVTVAGDRVLHITATAADGTCYFAVDARDGLTGGPVWHETGINLRTTSSTGCEQRKTPAGAGSVVVGVAPDGREALLDAYDGRVLWIAEPGQKVLAVDNLHALVRATDRKSLQGIRLGRKDPVWTRKIDSAAQAALTPCGAVIVDKRPDRIVVAAAGSGVERLNVRGEARVLACGPSGVVIADGRLVGYLPYPTGSGAGNGDGSGDTGSGSGGRSGKGQPGKDD